MTPVDIRTLASPGMKCREGRAHPHSQRLHDYSRSPMLVYWETTQACSLACRHCRAEAVSCPHPDQLSHEESLAMLRQVAEFGAPAPHLILTGGDPLEREDIYELIDEARQLGLTVSITPAATPKLTIEVMRKLKAHGIDSLGLSLDGSTAERHEGIRGIRGSYQWAVEAIRNAAALGFPIQVNTLVCAETVDDLPQIYTLLSQFAITRWSLFYLIAVGRGRELQPVSPVLGEQLMRWTYELSRQAPFAIKTTEAPSYRRVALSAMQEEGRSGQEIGRTSVYRGFGIRDGHGIMFVSNRGDVYPAGFLPLAAGNVREHRLANLYRDSPLFRLLHNSSQFHGKCGRCEFRQLCGGSRARAFAYTGDPAGSDPFCPYLPRESGRSTADARA
ncbi:TIGR04053 family radical SAM/SPASM domain-containing protein [Silvibacterium sp.]|uniref:TIGR04053 family radical SAM/SPASM domain-containing protein n=1 Tax=Silvibacterium sp. TaxID=1964179 RepID=UPI0039E4E811